MSGGLWSGPSLFYAVLDETLTLEIMPQHDRKLRKFTQAAIAPAMGSKTRSSTQHPLLQK